MHDVRRKHICDCVVSSLKLPHSWIGMSDEQLHALRFVGSSVAYYTPIDNHRVSGLLTIILLGSLVICKSRDLDVAVIGQLAWP